MRKPKQKAVKRRSVAALVEEMDGAARLYASAYGDAQWTTGYRSRFEADPNHNKAVADRLYQKGIAQWNAVDAANALFRKHAQRLLREARNA